MLKTSSESVAFVVNAKVNQLSTLSLKLVNVLLDTDLMEQETVLSDVELMKSSRTENAAANLDSTQSKEFAEFVLGTKFTIKVLDCAEYLAILIESLISALKPAFVFQNFGRWLMEHAKHVLLIHPMTKRQNLVLVMLDT